MRNALVDDDGQGLGLSAHYPTPHKKEQNPLGTDQTSNCFWDIYVAHHFLTTISQLTGPG